MNVTKNARHCMMTPAKLILDQFAQGEYQLSNCHPTVLKILATDHIHTQS